MRKAIRMRTLMSLGVLGAVACGNSGRSRVVVGDVTHPVEALVASHPLGAGQNLRADEIGRTRAATVHLVQIRGQETPHVHAEHDLVVTTLAGEGILHVGGRTVPLRAGDVAVIPRGIPHWFRNSGGRPAIAVATFTPPLDAPDIVPVDAVDSRTGDR